IKGFQLLKMLCVVVLHMAFLVGSSKLCPHRCFCYDASELVDCRSRGFAHIPHSIPHGTWLLELSGNKLSELRSTSFTGIWALRALLLSQRSNIDF
uniref:LRRNT domain-containing protein n=1 Tax=Sinocyclocheilus grahami TaxID=75366 RepID=A0A672K7W6_SINGR